MKNILKDINFLKVPFFISIGLLVLTVYKTNNIRGSGFSFIFNEPATGPATGFYTVVHLVIFLTSLYCIARGVSVGKYFWAWIMGGISILVNPFIPIELDRPSWLMIYKWTILCYLLCFFSLKDKRSIYEQFKISFMKYKKILMIICLTCIVLIATWSIVLFISEQKEFSRRPVDLFEKDAITDEEMFGMAQKPQKKQLRPLTDEEMFNR